VVTHESFERHRLRRRYGTAEAIADVAARRIAGKCVIDL